MVDSSKRKSLMILGGIVSLPLVSKTATASNAAAHSLIASTNQRLPSQPVSGNDPSLHIALELDGVPMMKITNPGDKLAILRRIDPGMISVGEKKYDLNQALLFSAYAIGAGHTRLIPIGEVAMNASDSGLRSRYKNKPLKMASMAIDNKHRHIPNNFQVLFA